MRAEALISSLDIAIIVVTAVTILYCTVGGVEAVIWSDFVQSVILIASTALILVWLIAYIQPFEDGNKRMSRLAANALLLAYGCCPLTFRSVEVNDYRAALLLFYEQNNVTAFKKLFLGQVAFAVNEYF